MELDSMPSRYIHSIYKQYTIFLKDQEAQKAAAAEDMMDELEDGGLGAMGGGGSTKQAPNPNANMISIREQQLAKIRENMAKANEEAQQESAAQKAAKQQTLSELQRNVMMGRKDE